MNMSVTKKSIVYIFFYTSKIILKQNLIIGGGYNRNTINKTNK